MSVEFVHPHSPSFVFKSCGYALDAIKKPLPQNQLTLKEEITGLIEVFQEASMGGDVEQEQLNTAINKALCLGSTDLLPLQTYAPEIWEAVQALHRAATHFPVPERN